MKPLLALAPSGNLELEIPSALAEGRSQFVEVPFTLAGLSIIKKVLQARAKAATPQTLGTRGMPTAADISRHLEAREKEERITRAKALEAKYGDIELDL